MIPKEHWFDLLVQFTSTAHISLKEVDARVDGEKKQVKGQNYEHGAHIHD